MPFPGGMALSVKGCSWGCNWRESSEARLSSGEQTRPSAPTRCSNTRSVREHSRGRRAVALTSRHDAPNLYPGLPISPLPTSFTTRGFPTMRGPCPWHDGVRPFDTGVWRWPNAPATARHAIASPGTTAPRVRFLQPRLACHPERRGAAPEPKDLWRSEEAARQARDPSTPPPAGASLRMTRDVAAGSRPRRRDRPGAHQLPVVPIPSASTDRGDPRPEADRRTPRTWPPRRQ